MEQYHALMRRILDHGVDRPDRTGTGTRAVFGEQMRFPLCSPGFSPEPVPDDQGHPRRPTAADAFPLVTTKKLHLRSIIHELLWFLRGSTDNRELNREGVTIWDEWADPDTGELGPVYGAQWRRFPVHERARDAHHGADHVDQIARLVRGLRDAPDSRRHVVTAWNPADLPRMALAPCHCLFQCFVAPADPAVADATGDDRPVLSCQLYQRSADVFLGVPFNIAGYSLLTLLLAQVCDYRPGDFIHTLGDAHLYRNHFDQAREQLARDHRPLPTVRLDPGPRELEDFRFDHVAVEGYTPHPAIRAPVAV